MLFVAIVKGEVSLISLHASLSFVYRRATDFLELILYPAILLKVFISCRSSLVEFLGSLMYTNISSANNESLTSSFQIRIFFIPLCCLIAIARTSSTIFKRYGVQRLIGNISHRCNFRELLLPSYRTHSFLSLVSLFLKASICSGPPLSMSISTAGHGDKPWEVDGKNQEFKGILSYVFWRSLNHMRFHTHSPIKV